MDIAALKHFDHIKIPVATNRECIDILIGQSDKVLLTVLEEREGKDPHKPNFVLNRLGTAVNRGRVPHCSDGFVW